MRLFVFRISVFLLRTTVVRPGFGLPPGLLFRIIPWRIIFLLPSTPCRTSFTPRVAASNHEYCLLHRAVFNHHSKKRRAYIGAVEAYRRPQENVLSLPDLRILLPNDTHA